MYKPNTIQIEFTQGCNRHCEFCGTSGLEKTPRFMEFDTLVHTVESLKRTDWHYKILLAGHGEPTLHPDHLNMIAYLRKELPNVNIIMMTNGYSVLKDIQNLEWLLTAGVTELIFDEYIDSNLDSIKTYLKENNIAYRVYGDGSKLFENKKSISFNPPIELAKPTIARNLTNHCGAGMPPLSEPKKARCTKVFREMYVRWDGNIAICCDDFRGEYGIANVNEMEIADIWMHPRFESARRFLYQGIRCFHPCSICATSPVRPGLLPDRMGKETLPEPTQKDYEIVTYRTTPYSNIRKREWEK